MTTAVDFNPLSPQFQQEPHGPYRRMRDEAPVHFLDAIGAWGLFRHEDCLHTLKHPEQFSARDFMKNAFGEFDPVPETLCMIALDPPDHTRVRKLANRAFTPAVIRGMKNDVEAVISGLLDETHDLGHEFDFTNDFAARVPATVTATILGIEPSVGADFKRWTIDLVQAPSRSVLSEDQLASMHRSKVEIREYFTELIAQRRKTPGKDLISALIRAEEDDQTLTELEILSLLSIMVVGGAETPSHLIGTTLWELFDNPDAMAAVKADPEKIDAALEETLRHQSPVHFIFQTAAQDVQMRGITIPEGSMAFSFISSANRDERVFSDPDTFDINRNSRNSHLAFARGPHYCIGDNLGRLMCSSAVRQALTRMPELSPVHPDIEWMPSFWIRGPKELRVSY
ncbi:MAG: cytochrome P450 [Actinomycetia bacterium]|nr:cytochrome P450 [Actinomycetes bacterium]